MILSRLTTSARSLLILSLAILAFVAVPAGAAPRSQGAVAEWAGWGLTASFQTGAPIIKFAAYVGTSNPPMVLDSRVIDITGQCVVRDAAGNPATLTIDADGYANFDGNRYIECQTPDWGLMVREMAPNLRPANTRDCNCPPTPHPFWASGDLILNPVAPGTFRANPVIDASQLGLTFSLPTNGVLARSRMTHSGGAFTSTSWAYASVGGNHVLAGLHGRLAVAVARHFNELTFMDTYDWEPYFTTTVTSQRFGQWLDPANSGSYTAAQPLASFNLYTGPATVFIGRNSSNGQMLQGRVRIVRSDPGCFGN